jgi:predicted amidohydrolase YtcJ
MGTGQEKEGLALPSLRSLDDLAQLKIKPHHYRGEWLVGFGWDHFQFNNGTLPTRQDLDRFFPDTPVYFIRRDGHAAWVNSAALGRSKPLPESVIGGEIGRGSSGNPNGILIDRAMPLIGQSIPDLNEASQRHFFLEAIKTFNAAGFTHIRDMGGSENQWNILTKLDEERALTLYVEQNFSFDTWNGFEKALKTAETCRKNASPHLRVAGVKCFIDGALGSEGAWLSQKYPHSQNSGLQLWNEKELSEILTRAWAQNTDVAVHALGDAAVDFLASTAVRLFEQGIQGQLHVEHAEVMRPVTAQKLKLIKARVHMQPCHWLSDKSFLKEKLGGLFADVFPWRILQQEGIAVHLGSDAPIEPPSIFSNLMALKDSAAAGVPAFIGSASRGHEHPDNSWGSECKTEFSAEQDKKVMQIFFDGIKI